MTPLDLGLSLRSFFFHDGAEALHLANASELARREAEKALANAARREVEALRRSGRPRILLGTALDAHGEPYPVELSEREVTLGGHWLVNGATGSGKTFWTLGMLSQLIAKRPRNIVVFDMKGELASLLRRVVLPALVASSHDAYARDLIRRIAVIAPFDDTTTVPFQVLTRDATLPIEVQAHEVAGSFGRTVGRDLGILQQTMLKYALLLAIDVGASFVDVPRILEDRDALRRALERTSLPEVRRYFVERFPRERSGSLVSLLARLDSLLMHPGLRRLLTTPGMIRFDRLLEHAITIVDLGGAPAGMRELGAFFGQMLFQRMVRSIFTREIRANTPPVTIVCDEFQELLSPEMANDAERVLALARSQKCFLWLCFQQAAQVEAVSPLLLRVLAANCNYALQFRTEPRDADRFAPFLHARGNVPRATGGFPDPRERPAVLSAEEERRRVVDRIPTMPDRLAWFANRRRPYGAFVMKTPVLPLGEMAEEAARLPREVREVIEHGVLAVPVDAVDAPRERGRAPGARGAADATPAPPPPTAPAARAPDPPVRRPAPPTAPTMGRRDAEPHGAAVVVQPQHAAPSAAAPADGSGDDGVTGARAGTRAEGDAAAPTNSRRPGRRRPPTIG